MRNLIAAGFSGSLHLVNVRGGDVAGRPTVRSIDDVEGEVELAVIVVPANAVVDVARACAAKGVRALVVLTAGFAEIGPAGRARQDELLAVCRAAGMRMVGPNCLGVASPRPEIALNATVAPAAPTPGDIAFASQSGGFGSAAIDAAAARGIGFSSFVTMGDKADLSGSDFLEYWEQDPDTAVLLLYLDSFGNPRRFARVARRITTAKPIVAVKSARTAGRRAPSSRTGALLAAADVTVDALFAHAGVLRAETVGEMFDVAGLLARQPLPRRRPRRGAHQCQGARDRLRGRLPGGGAAGPGALGRHAEAARRGPAGRRLDREPGGHDRVGDRGSVRAVAARPAR